MTQQPQNTPIRVLIVDDAEDDFILTSSLIHDIPFRKFDIEWCANYKEAVKSISKAKHDIYFIDYRLGAKSGLDLLREPLVQQCEAPIILLTGYGNREIDFEAMNLGAVDYLIKSELNPEKLERCIRYSLDRAITLRASRASERKYRNIFEKTRDVIFLADANLKISDMNEAVIDLLGFNHNNLLNRSVYDLMTKTDEIEELKKKVQEGGQVDDFQIELATANQIKKVVMISMSSEVDSQGQNYILGILHDITLLKRAEEITLQSEKLEAKGRVIRTLAHEIRNPLNNITVSIDQLKSIVAKEDAELLDIVYRGAKKINDLINELMKDSSRYSKMKFTVMPLRTVVDRAISDATDRIVLKKIKLEVFHPPGQASAMVDIEKINVAFLNIIINAIEAMEENKGVLRIDIQAKPNFNEVTFADNGCGMSEEVISHLFEPYFTAKPNGVGIGLASAMAIIQSHKSTIHVESKLNQGTKFTISFPSL